MVDFWGSVTHWIWGVKGRRGATLGAHSIAKETGNMMVHYIVEYFHVVL